MVTSLDYAGIYERVRGDSARSPLRQLTALSRSTNLNANSALWSLPGSAPTLGQAFPAGTGAALPCTGPGPALQLQGSARAHCSGQTSHLPAGASSGRSSAAPTPKAMVGWG